ncbi:rod shape-determining protein MreC [Inconstantimicrobium porci]|uniref:Cell shape-determining protein MreC n=1 Tax=Inconstantimicrobium porci TaxID=2652291 RepID=A0A7X2MYB0_9CLOT|nr:rod shape-determining protein MreC [Inconstantimicrobium porci]MSR90860.1 rod shape-determining protein MreC [Inconstantimicrobium porci]
MKFLKNKLAVAIIVLSVSFLSLIIYSVKRDGSSIAGISGTALNPIQKVFFTINSKIKNEFQYVINFSSIRKENNALKEQNIKLENELIEYDNLKEENEKLRSMLNFKNQRDEYNYIGANIIGLSGESFLNGYLIDKGTKNGIAKDMVIITGEGLVGKVIEAHDTWAKAESLINENIAVAGKVQSTKETGIVKGFTDSKKNNLAKIEQLPMTSAVKKGDVVATSMLGNSYPDGIRIGEVISVEEDKVKVMKTAVIKPYINFNKLQQVFVVSPKDPKNITEDGIKY